MVNLQALEAALGKVERIRDHEFTFEVGDIEITLRPLRPDEETEVQKYAQVAMETVAEDGNQAAFADFMDRLRHASLGFSVVKIGALDLRDVEYIETGELDDNENPVSIPKWEAMVQIIGKDWGRMMLSQVFGKFGEMLDRAELRAQEAVKFQPVDLEEEIERTERRLAELKTTRDRVKTPAHDPVRQTQAAVIQNDQVTAEARNQIRNGPQQREPEPVSPDVQSAVDAVVDEVQQAPPQQPQQPQGRRSAVPESVGAPERPTTPEQSQGAQQPQQPQQPPEPELDKMGIPIPHEGDSFFDPSDPEEAMAAEGHRQAVMRQRHLAKERAEAEQRRLREEMGIPSEETMTAQRIQENRSSQSPRGVNLDRSPGGLRSAANLNDAMMDANAGSVRSGRPNQPQAPGPGTPAQLHGKPVYKMPAQYLDRPQSQRQHGDPAESPVKINNPSAGGRQPKFRGPNR